MKIAFVAKSCEHVLRPMCDELYEKYNDDFVFVETGNLDKNRVGIGSESERDYILKSENHMAEAMEIIENADVVIFGGADIRYIQSRIDSNRMTLYYSERLFKKGFWQKFNPITGKKLRERFIIPSQNSNFHLLCASAYAPLDFYSIGAFRGKMYKWGYQIEVKEKDIEELIKEKPEDGMNIIWIGRLVKLKHCDHAIRVIKRLKKDGKYARLTIIGDGPERNKLEKLALTLGVAEQVDFKGRCTIDITRSIIDKANIFLFTSDFKEGWGVTLNECMNAGCACVCSHAAGSTNYLVDEEKDGFIYQSGNIDVLYYKVKALIEDKELRENIGRNAYKKMYETWNPKYSTKRLIALCEALVEGKDTELFKEGPCSKAEVLKENWY